MFRFFNFLESTRLVVLIDELKRIKALPIIRQALRLCASARTILF